MENCFTAHVRVVLLGEGRAVSACPVSVPHSPGEGVYWAEPRGRTDRPGGWLRGGWRGASSTAGAERLYCLLPWWGCSGQGCHEVRDGLLWFNELSWRSKEQARRLNMNITESILKILHGIHLITTWILSYSTWVHKWLICGVLSLSAGMASHFWVSKVKPWKFSPGTMMLKCKSVIFTDRDF